MVRKNKRGQVAIWVIVAIVIVVGIGFFIFVKSKTSNPQIYVVDEMNPKQFIERCTRNAVEEALDKMIPQGGFVEPKNFKLYEGIKVEYLCQNIGNYNPCINQHPMFINEMTLEVDNYTTPKIEECFVSLREELEKKAARVEMGSLEVDVSFAPDLVFVNIDRKLKIEKEESVVNFDDFKVSYANPVYDLGLIASEIASQEAKYCYFEYVGYMILYPEISIEKTSMSDSTKIYSISDKKSGKELNIAIRSCAIPAGI